MNSVWSFDGREQGVFVMSFPIGRQWVNRHSAVVASITELSQPPAEALDYPFIGAASISITEIAPGDDGIVWARINVDWGSALNWRAYFFISTP
jgi:hypothetical protein